MKIPIFESLRTFWALIGIRIVVALPLIGLTIYVGLQGIGWNPYSGENLLQFVRLAWIALFPALAASGILGNLTLGMAIEVIITYSTAILVYSIKERKRLKHLADHNLPTK